MVQPRVHFFSRPHPHFTPYIYTTKTKRRDNKAMVVAQRGPQRQRALSVLLLVSVLLGTASAAAAGGVLFKGKDSNAHIKKESAVCDASAVPSFFRLALRYRGGESKSGGAWEAGEGGREGGMMIDGWATSLLCFLIHVCVRKLINSLCHIPHDASFSRRPQNT